MATVEEAEEDQDLNDVQYFVAFVNSIHITQHNFQRKCHAHITTFVQCLICLCVTQVVTRQATCSTFVTSCVQSDS